MALLPFKKLTLISHVDDKERILNILSRLSCAEIISTCEIEGTEKVDTSADIDKLLTASARLKFCFDFWRQEKITLLKYVKRQEKENTKITNYEKVKTPLLEKLRAQKPEVAFDDFTKIGAEQDDVWEVVERLEKLSFELTELKGEQARLATLLEQLAPYKNVDIAFSKLKATKRVAYYLGIMPQEQFLNIDLTDLEGVTKVDCGDFSHQTTALFIAPTDAKIALEEKLLAGGFLRTTFDYDVSAQEKIDELTQAKYECFKRSVALSEEAVAFEPLIREKMEILFDFFRIEQSKLDAQSGFAFSKRTFVLTAWVPAHLADSVENAFADSKLPYYSEYSEPAEDEKYPTLCKNNAVVTPYESITNMYSAPDPREIDPNPFVAFFYFVLFGLMVSDAAYGIILTIAGFGLYALKKPRRGEGSLFLIIGMGGISTFVWGALFNGWFGESLMPWGWFNPMNEPLKMLILSVCMGFAQILFGMGISAVSKFKKGKPLDAIFGEIAWFMLFVGLGLFAASGAVKALANAKLAGVIVLALGGAGVLIGGALHKKGIKGKIIGALGNVYGITGFLSDILSYCRLFGLGLATGVVGMVVNLIAGILCDLIPVVGYVLYVAILVVGHIFNIAINTLGAYVHNSRLQYVEFFSRFYTGGGHLFKPLGSDLKYIHLGK